ncbi:MULTISPECIES: IS630 transposase-related protein [Candidatus Rhabdochlamydia]|uniref:IS630 transposase-related protein n=1 Tax=Candidatus Rhabdochlamydia TaxID=292833 RepID=UPI003312F958
MHFKLEKTIRKKHFGLTLQSIFYALQKLKITRKKRLCLIRKGTQKQKRNKPIYLLPAH